MRPGASGSRGGAWRIVAATGKAQLSSGVRGLLGVPGGDPGSDLAARLPIDSGEPGAG